MMAVLTFISSEMKTIFLAVVMAIMHAKHYFFAIADSKHFSYKLL